MIERRFSPGDQEAFAALSGDRNPLHLDPVAARRLIFGGQVTHGVHALLFGLNEIAREAGRGRRFCAARVVFRKSIPVDAKVLLRIVRQSADEARVRIELQGRTAATIRVRFQSVGEVDDVGKAAGSAPPGDQPVRSTPRELSAEEIEDARGSVALFLDRELASRLFPDVLRCLTPVQLAQLLATTRIVGMECPGLHSLFAELDVEFEPSADCAPLVYEVTNYDPRFHRVEMALTSSGLRGTAIAFLRPPPREQVAMADIAEVLDGEFAGQRVLVVGGSRGLGEVAAKLLAAGGAQVKLTYFCGEEDAQRVVEDIVSAGGEAEALCWNVLLDPDPLRSELNGWVPTHVCYFASPFIAAFGDDSRGLFAKFCDYYVSGFASTIDALGDPGSEGFRVLYPSSIFLDERPEDMIERDMIEYVNAKRAGEALCDSLQKKHGGLRISVPRLPRMATDQTQSLFAGEAADPLPVLLRVLRELRSI
jgi:hypothetical protein